MATIKLKTNDHKIYEVSIQVANHSQTIKTMLEDLGLENGDEDEVIPVSNVDGKILEKVIEWAEHHKDDEYVGADNNQITDWDKEFIGNLESKYDLFALTRAANFLDVRGLLGLCCKSVANSMKSKSPREIRNLFDLP